MGKIGGSSWLAAVKRVFRSPTKDNEKKSRRREEHELEDEDNKRGKRKWIFRKPSTNQETTIHHCGSKNITTTRSIITAKVAAPAVADAATSVREATAAAADDTKQRHALAVAMATTSAAQAAAAAADDAKQRHALAVAMATTAAAQAAVATAQAAIEVARLSRPSLLIRQHYAAVAIQTAFRGYLARRALRALKGLVKLQALVRGYNVRKQAKVTLECMKALMRVQARVRDQRMRLSYDEGSTMSFSSSDPNSSMWGVHLSHDTKYSTLLRNKSRYTDDDWVHLDDHPPTFEDIQAMLQETKLHGVSLKREKRRGAGRDTYASEGEVEEFRPRWTRRDEWDTRRRASLDHRRESIISTIPIKTVEMDTSLPYLNSTTPNAYKPQRPSSYYPSSPIHRTTSQSPLSTPSLSKTRTLLQVHSASPRCLREVQKNRVGNEVGSIPSYMAATVSAKARSRSLSAPKQRSPTSERERASHGTAKKCLFFPESQPSIHDCNEGANMSDYGLRSSYGFIRMD